MKNFSATEALEYDKRGLIEDWIHEFLTTTGKNEGLSTGLKKEKRFFVGPRMINLDELQRICGPEKILSIMNPKRDGRKKLGEFLVE